MYLTILYPCSQAQEACGALEIDNALDMIKALEDELNQIKLTANDGKLLPLPGETVSWEHGTHYTDKINSGFSL